MKRRVRPGLAGGLMVLAAGGAGPLQAAPDQLTVLSPTELRFGTFAVPTTGFREVTAAGGINSSGIFSIDDSGVGPARFTVRFDRGDNSRRRLDIVIELVFTAPAPFARGGLTARLGRYQTDLPGYAVVQPGQVIRLDITNCTQRVCERSFNLGGRLDIERAYGGGPVSIAVPLDAVLVSAR